MVNRTSWLQLILHYQIQSPQCQGIIPALLQCVGVTPTLVSEDVSEDQDVLTNTVEITRKKNKQNTTGPHHIQKQRDAPNYHPEIQRDALASRRSKYKSIYLIVSLVSLVPSVPLRDYRPFLIWKTKKNTPVEFLLLCLHAATSAFAISQSTSFLKSWSSGSQQEWLEWRGDAFPSPPLVTVRGISQGRYRSHYLSMSTETLY